MSVSQQPRRRKCPECGYSFEPNLPGVDTGEEPYYTLREDGRTTYICSSVCMASFLKKQDYTAPRGDERV